MPTIRQQLIRAMTSAAANYRAGRSRKEWFAKLCITIEAIDESLFWLIICCDLDYINEAAIFDLKKEATELVKILTRATAKQKEICSNDQIPPRLASLSQV